MYSLKFCFAFAESFGSMSVVEFCKEPCGMILKGCEHICQGTCGKCRGRLHAPCSQPCGNRLICGHMYVIVLLFFLFLYFTKIVEPSLLFINSILYCFSCDDPCREFCSMCRKPCQVACKHSKCPLFCGVPCKPCKVGILPFIYSFLLLAC